MNRIMATLALAAGIACAAFGYEPQRHNDTFTTNGVTYAQRGGLGASDYVVTDADLSTNNTKLVEIIQAVSPTPDFTTNNVQLVETIEATAPAPGDYATVSNRAMTALQSFTENDPIWNAEKSGYATKVALQQHIETASQANSQKFAQIDSDIAQINRDLDNKQDTLRIDDMPRLGSQSLVRSDGIKIAIDDAASAATNYTDSVAQSLEKTIPNDISRTQTDAVLVHKDGSNITNLFYIRQATSSLAGLMTAADKSALDTLKSTVEEQSTAIQTVTDDEEQTRQIVTTWENFLDGSNVVFSITNYISGTYSLDAAKMRILELRDGEYREVYNSRDEILLHINDFKTNDFRVATNQVIGAVNTAIENKADRDWGKYTSAGGEAPSNTVYMTAPNTVFAGGLEYERVAVGEGTICVLTTRGAPVWTQGDEGTFKFQDDGGTNYFGFAKTDSYTIGANTDGITVSGDMVTMTYNITMSGRPCVWYKADLTSDTPWEQLNLPDGTATPGASHGVIWDNNPPAGTQECHINVGSAPQGFFRATIEVAGEAKFMTNMPADLSGGIICTNTATRVNGVIKPTFNGSTVIWNWSALQ